MDVSKLYTYILIFAGIFVIIAASMVIFWMVYKFYRRRTKNNFNGRNVEMFRRNSCQPIRYQHGMIRTSVTESNEMRDVYRKNRKDRSAHRCSDTGIGPLPSNFRNLDIF